MKQKLIKIIQLPFNQQNIQKLKRILKMITKIDCNFHAINLNNSI